MVAAQAKACATGNAHLKVGATLAATLCSIYVHPERCVLPALPDGATLRDYSRRLRAGKTVKIRRRRATVRREKFRARHCPESSRAGRPRGEGPPSQETDGVRNRESRIRSRTRGQPLPPARAGRGGSSCVSPLVCCCSVFWTLRELSPIHFLRRCCLKILCLYRARQKAHRQECLCYWCSFWSYRFLREIPLLRPDWRRFRAALPTPEARSFPGCA